MVQVEENKVKVGARCRKPETRATVHATRDTLQPRLPFASASHLPSFPSPSLRPLLITLCRLHFHHGLYNLPTV